MLTDVVEDSFTTHTKNPNYWGTDEKYPQNRLPYIDEFKGLFIPDEATRLAALRSRKIDVLHEHGGGDLGSVDQMKSLQRTNPELQIKAVQRGPSYNVLGLNYRVPPLDDINVRRAMQMALDHKTINDTLYSGLGRWKPEGNLSTSLAGFHVPYDEWPAEIKKYYTYNPAGAEKLLDDAGYPRGADGTRFKLNMVHRELYGLAHIEIAVGYLAEIGIDLEVDTMDTPSWGARRKVLDYQVTDGTLAWEESPDYPISNYLSENPSNREYWGKPSAKMDTLIDNFYAATTLEERQRLAQEIDMLFISGHWAIWGSKGPKFYMAQPWIKGWNGEYGLSNQETAAVFARLWVDSELKKEMGF